MRRIVVVLMIGAVGLTACGSGARTPGAWRTGASATLERHPKGFRIARTGAVGHPGRPAPPQAATRPSEGSGKSAGAPQPCSPSSGGTQGTAAVQLVDVRVGSHDGYDRATFEFAPPVGLSSGPFDVPPYRIEGAGLPTEDGSGLPVPLGGSSFARVVFWGASGWDVDGNQTYQGPADLRPAFQTLSEVRMIGDFERVLSWGMGLAGPSCWQLSVLRDPPRVVIDFPHVAPVGPADLHPDDARDQALEAFMDVRIHRDAAAAEPYLSLDAKSWFDARGGLVSPTSNPHYAGWELLSRTEANAGSLLFVVRIHEEVTGQGETDSFTEALQIGPGTNYLGHSMDSVVLAANR